MVLYERTKRPLLWYQCCQSVTQLDIHFFIFYFFRNKNTLTVYFVQCADNHTLGSAAESHSSMCAYVVSGFDLKLNRLI